MVKIICRIKPPKEDNIELISDSKIYLYKKDKNLLDKSIIKPYQFELDRIYDCNINTEEIYHNEIKPKLINDFGVFIYGHTGSGKTYTMFGNEDSKGIFDLISDDFGKSFELEAIDLRYNGIFDLFTDNKITLYSNEKNEDVCYNSKKQEITPENYEYFKNKIYESRTRGKSKHNLVSSRSHLVLYIHKDNKKYTIVDLAGNERKPKLFDKVNEQETTYINSSLLALKECYRSYGKPYMPYRRSDLTRLLKNIILKKNLIICTIHSGFPYFYDSIDTLNYIYSLLNKVKTKPDFYERKILPISPKKLPKIKEKFNLNFKEIEQSMSEDKKVSPRNLFYSKDDLVKSNDSIADTFADIIDDDVIDDLEDDDFNYKLEDDYGNIADAKSSSGSLVSLKDRKDSISEKSSCDDYLDDFEEDSSSSSLKMVLKKDLSNRHKRKIIGVINHFIYKKVVSNYRQLLNKDISDDELNSIILTSASTFDFCIRELLKL